ncbi:Uncharacterised protein [Bordetella pertussis]|nr:Uncharacterised protein [Bordetella pertussis]CFP61702.1 Uncharacterised protein [Bordetella pertussis]CFW41181.1 Uncharacterised protein [Bordetella pertussis]
MRVPSGKSTVTLAPGSATPVTVMRPLVASVVTSVIVGTAGGVVSTVSA